ncbi:DNA-directed RNA polymerase subunit alpha C-terminal domain-containing protein [Larkinella soli]|uniref:DNA-directed RNA polymerase subunit alpha C-terminal domain-containing protein n=1 Tax=Larkinella soli TaxID=1770527 RepID=UPI000FFC058E|nr:DNA-directed RNA polymerase subunit alpha C-terminal domain-containing protein [Larkinella soli]
MAAERPLPKVAKPAQRALAHAGITSLDQLTQFTEAELMQLHGMGKSTLRMLKASLAGHQLSLAR